MKEKKYFKYVLWLLVFYYLIYYIPYFLDGTGIIGDDFYWWIYEKNGVLEGMFYGGWDSGNYLGIGVDSGIRIPTPTDLFLRFFSVYVGPVFAGNFVYVFMFGLMIYATYLFFRAWGVVPLLSLIIGIFTTFSPAFHTFIRTGHNDKIMLNPMIMFAFAFITFFFKSGNHRFIYAFLTAFSLFLSFNDGDPQVFLYYLPFFSIYAVSLFFLQHTQEDQQNGDGETLWVQMKRNFVGNRKRLPMFILIAVMSGVMSVQTITINFEALFPERDLTGSPLIPETVETADVPPEAAAAEKDRKYWENWFWATQWSFPKIDTIDLFVPGFMGYLSGSPTEPYWGRVGQTEGWDQSRSGYQNYSLMVNYLGVFIIIFMVYGLFYAHPVLRITSIFLLLLFLFLSFGKFSFLYQWFYKIPQVDQFRNPNRFLQLFHFTASILFGFGLNHYFLRVRNRLAEGRQEKNFNFFRNFLIAVLGIGALGLVGLLSEEGQILAYFVDRFPYPTATLILSNMYFFWIKAVVIFSAACLLLHYAHQNINFKNAQVWVAAMLIFGLLEVYVVNRKFYDFRGDEREKKTAFHLLFNGEIPEYNKKLDFDNPMYNKRMYIPKQSDGSLGGNYLHFLFYSRSLPLVLFDFTVVRKASEIPQRYLNYYRYLNNPDMRLLKIPGVRYIFSKSPIYLSFLDLVYMDEIKSINEKVYLYMIKDTLPYFYFRGDPEFADSMETILGRMNESSFDIWRSVMLHEGVKNILTPEQIAAIANHPENSIELVERDGNSLVLKADLKTPVIMVLNNQYNIRWQAKSGDRVLPSFPGNYYFNAFYVTPEDKEIEVKFVPENTNQLYYGMLTGVNYLSFLVVMFYLIWNRFKSGSKKSRKKHH